MFRVTVEEITPPTAEGLTTAPVQRLVQTVDQLDLAGVIRAVNTPPRAPRVRKSRAQGAAS